MVARPHHVVWCQNSGGKQMLKRQGLIAALVALVLLVGASPAGSETSSAAGTKRYLVVFAGEYAVDGTYAVDSTYAVVCNYAVSTGYAVANGYAVGCDYAVGGDYAVNQTYAVAHDYAVSLVQGAGGTVVSDLFGQIGVLVVESPNALFADLMRTYAVVDEVGSDFGVKSVPGRGDGPGGGGPEQSEDLTENQQWGMRQIQAPEAHALQAGWRKVDVGILDTGIDGLHLDFDDDGLPGGSTNVDCYRGRNSIRFMPNGPGVGVLDPCIDNAFHGTHVAGIVAAQANGVGTVGVAPNVTLVPIKVCDASGYCYAHAVVDGITYAGDQKLDVINMSFFVDDDEFQTSTEFKCLDDPTQSAFRKSVERAIAYARKQGVAPVAALGNSDTDLANPPAGNKCEVVPAESPGVIGTTALGNAEEKASYSNYGHGEADVAAPGGTSTGDPATGIWSTMPGNTYGAISGTSMASPHAAGVAALIVSQYGQLGSNGDVRLSPESVQWRLERSSIDQGLKGYDECFGQGRINALRAVTGTTSKVYDASAPFCPEYTE
jgi:subtilisin family serine protease